MDTTDTDTVRDGSSSPGAEHKADGPHDSRVEKANPPGSDINTNLEARYVA